jgi:NAD(P)H-hydrate epimerase
MSNIVSQIVQLFGEAGKAHHHAYIATDGADDDWPLWYAQYLQPKLSSLLGQELTQSELVYWLVKLDKEYHKARPDESWPHWYAAALVKAFLP